MRMNYDFIYRELPIESKDSQPLAHIMPAFLMGCAWKNDLNGLLCKKDILK
jgi:hypothetical protein